MLKIKFSWGTRAVHREIFLIQGAAQLQFYFLQMNSAHQEMSSTEEALSYWMETRLDQSNTFLGCTKSLVRNIMNSTPNLVFCTLSHSSIAMSQARKETPLSVPAVAQDGLCFPKDNWSKPIHPRHTRTPPCSCLCCTCKAPKLNLYKSIKQQQVAKLQRNGPLHHSTWQVNDLISSTCLLGKTCKAGRGGKAQGEQFLAVTTVRGSLVWKEILKAFPHLDLNGMESASCYVLKQHLFFKT